MSNKPRTWSELKTKRERAGSENSSPQHANSFHLIPTIHNTSYSNTSGEALIHSFPNFQLLRRTFTNLRTLPTPMYQDWIACCQRHISDDIVGNTPQENKENHNVASAFATFVEEYETLIKDSTIDEDVRSQQIQLSLLKLLRTLLTKPTNLAKTILKQSIGELETQ
jgi:hypothetical protein